MLVCTVCLHEGCRLRDEHMLRGRCTPGAWDLPRYPRREGGASSPCVEPRSWLSGMQLLRGCDVPELWART